MPCKRKNKRFFVLSYYMYLGIGQSGGNCKATNLISRSRVWKVDRPHWIWNKYNAICTAV